MNSIPRFAAPGAGRTSALLVAALVAMLLAAPISAAPVADAAPAALGICVACHGAHGEGASTGVPRLAGQNADYLSHALAMFKAGTRTSAIMQPIAGTLDDAEMRSLADYFSHQSAAPVDAATPASPELAPAGKLLAEKGAGNVPACFSCHAAQGQGNGARFPSIAGQPAQFLVDRLHEFQARARAKTPDAGSMTAVAALLDELQIEESAAYLSKLGR
ncbi:MAG TPA: c-type cytochrome [Caldimonas sp.]|jgi:cytochrome c553|nr:c-type cytochrome [Caldimonas sp.]HEV7574861.1 c-type cytochrome [Caldimonas sp.]